MKSSPIHRSRPDLGRRRFLGQAGCAGLSALPALSTLATLATTSALAADTPGGYRAVVCLLLTGGNDSFNMLAPRGTAEHAEYAQVRQDLALPRESLLALNPTTPAGLDLGLHPSMPELAALFESGKAAFIANVGTLLQPGTRKEQVEAGSVPVPAGLYSHSDQVEQWQTSLPQSRGGTGWAGRMADVLQSVNVNRRLSMNISVAGSNAWQAGRNNAEYAITPDGAEGLRDYAPPGTPLAEVTRPEIRVNSSAVDSQLALEYRNLLQQAFATSRRNAIEAAELFRAATAPDLPAGLSWPGSRLAAQLRMVARTISARDRLGVSRQTFFVEYGGWDHHDDVLANQLGMLREVSEAIGAFQQALTVLGMADDVVLFSASDFGRSLTSNGRGSDHAWGGNAFVVGGPVKGRKIYGRYPALFADNPLDVGRGRLIPTTAVDQYFAELALWMGVSRTDLPLVLPNIARFHDLATTTAPVGFLG